MRSLLALGGFACRSLGRSFPSSVRLLQTSAALAKKSEQDFVDSARVFVRAGTGGQGSLKLGASGGDGGDVFVEARRGLQSLAAVSAAKRYRAQSGENANARLQARKGESVTIPVPPGTVVMLDSGAPLGDLSREGDCLLVARGGDGGSRRTNTAMGGLRGDALHIRLELKSIADVGLVGFPNAGKSSLLRAVSSARPAVANYPFTTLRPHIGKINYPDFSQILVADIPGLIEGAHENRGMGHNFLRHIERTAVLLFVLDVGGFQLSPRDPFRSAFESLTALVDEMSQYRAAMLDKPSIIAVNKMDTPESAAALSKFTQELASARESDPMFKSLGGVISISTATGEGIPELKAELARICQSLQKHQQRSGDAKESFEDKLLQRDQVLLNHYRDQAKLGRS
eukprot:m.157094 g.157094  ORF g.157094 m.157094 type:complete len:400 (+) comp10226_c0_seq2:3533-4732(+)